MLRSNLTEATDIKVLPCLDLPVLDDFLVYSSEWFVGLASFFKLITADPISFGRERSGESVEEGLYISEIRAGTF